MRRFAGGVNNRWPVWEATHRFRASATADDGKPAAEYPHSNGQCSVTDSYVYRGARIRALLGFLPVWRLLHRREFWLRRARSGLRLRSLDWPKCDGWFGAPVTSKTQMKQSHRGQEAYRRALVVACAAVVLVTGACGSPVAGAPVAATPGPVTADSIQAALNNSTMDSGHFRMHGTIIKNRVYFPVNGNGVLQQRPEEALLMNLSVQTFGNPPLLKMTEITVGGKIYSRVGSGHWSSKASSSSILSITTYVGEEIISGAGVWHARSVEGKNTYDIWVRESDGYLVQLKFAGTSGSYTMEFFSYNKNPVIVAPK